MIYNRETVLSFLWDDKGNKRMVGWWKDCLFEVYDHITNYQQDRGIKGNLAELGVMEGRSLLPLLNFLGNDEHLVAIDIKNLDTVYSRVEKHYPDQLSRVHLYTANSLKGGGKRFANHMPYRMFYVDGDHRYTSALNDLNIAKSYLAEGGVIFVDDYENPRYGKDVSKAIKDFITKNPDMEIAFTTGQTAWITFKDQSQPMLQYLKEHLVEWDIRVDQHLACTLFFPQRGLNDFR